MSKRLRNRVLCDLVKLDAAHWLTRDDIVQDVRQMPRNGFAFTIRVGGQPYFAGITRSRAQQLDDWLLGNRDAVPGFEVGYHVNTEPVLG